MPRVDITVNGRPYPVACGSGEEQRVRDLAAYVDRKMNQVGGSGGGSEAHRLVLASILMADELHDMKSKIDSMSGNPDAAPAIGMTDEDEDLLCGAVEHLIERLNSLANRIETVEA